MSRPKLCLCKDIKFRPDITYFQPRGGHAAKLKIMELTVEELEALRLKNSLGLEQTECAKKMRVSQSTFQRILAEAHRKVADALTGGNAIKITKHH